jgi:hypothetical protein
MKTIRYLLISLAGGLALSANARAEDVVLPGNPYALVVARNIFGLNPPTPVDPSAASSTPPPKITLNGITDILGQMQALFKAAATAKPGKPAGDESYILSEGQRQDDIEVVKIDEKAGIVTFNNHGETQELTLVAATGTSAPTAGGNPGNPANGFRPAPGASSGGGNIFGGRGGTPYGGGFGGSNRGNANSGMGGGYGGGNGGNNSGGLGNGLNFGNSPTRASSFLQQPQNTMSVEESDAIIEVSRELTKQQVQEGALPPLPPTEATPPGSPGAPQQ